MSKSPGPSADSLFTPSVTYCVRRGTRRWSQSLNEDRWVEYALEQASETQLVILSLSQTSHRLAENVTMWARLGGIDDASPAEAFQLTIPWLWAGDSSCLATVSVHQIGCLTTIQVYQDRYITDFDWPKHVGQDGLRALILDALDGFDAKRNLAELPSFLKFHIESTVQSRMSAVIAELSDSVSVSLDDDYLTARIRLESVWDLRSAVRRLVVSLQACQPHSDLGVRVLEYAVAELDTLLGVLNTQQLLRQAVNDSLWQAAQRDRDAAERDHERMQTLRETRHDRLLAKFAAIFVGPSLVFAFFSVPTGLKHVLGVSLEGRAGWIVVLTIAVASAATVWLVLPSADKDPMKSTRGED